MKKMFELFDKDHNNFISKEELRDGLSKLGEVLTEQDLKDILEEADLDGDGNISYE